MQPIRDTPFKILVLADLSGRESRGVHEPLDLDHRRIHTIDRDDFDAVFARLDVRVRSAPSANAAPIELSFRSLDELHPDHLYATVPSFEALRGLRQHLQDPRSFAAAAAELGLAPTGKTSASPATRTARPPGDLLAATLAETVEATQRSEARAGSGSALVDALLRELVIPHVTPALDPRSAELVASVDAATSAHMRALLREPHLREVEAAWRGLELLVRRLETGAALQLHLLDVTQRELAEDLAAADGLEHTRLHRRLVEESVGVPDGEPWALWLGASRFDATEDDAALVERLGELARAAGAAFIAAGHERLAGCDALAATPDPADWQRRPAAAAERAWAELRQRPAARHVALCAPRLLLRLPYGARAGTVERFAFEELEGGLDHAGYLWGSGALAAALLLGDAFTRAGWGLRPDSAFELDGLPADVRTHDGEPTLQPPAEVLLTDRAAGALAARGLCVLRSVCGRDAVRVTGLDSLAGTPLAGPWS
jgi:type VI secretion system protein ImpC